VNVRVVRSVSRQTSTSAGATRTAAAIERSGRRAARCATRMHPRLCATSIAPGRASMHSSSRASHDDRSGLCQSSWCTLMASLKDRSRWVCQWSSSDPPRPGTMMTGATATLPVLAQSLPNRNDWSIGRSAPTAIAHPFWR
jgi:hypothetical protein